MSQKESQKKSKHDLMVPNGLFWPSTTGGGISGQQVHGGLPTCSICIRALHELEQARGVDDEVLGPAGEVRQVHRRKVKRVQHVVPV